MCSLVPSELALTIHSVFEIIWVVAVILVVLFCILDAFKILTSQDEKDIRNRQSMIIKRILICVLIFLLIYIIQFIFAILHVPEASEAMECAKKIILGK